MSAKSQLEGNETLTSTQHRRYMATNEEEELVTTQERVSFVR